MYVLWERDKERKMREDIIRNGSNVQKRNEMFSELAGGSLNSDGTLTQKAVNLRDPDLRNTRYQFLSDPGLYREDEPDTTGLDQTQRQLLHTARVLNSLGPGNGTNFDRPDENALITNLANSFINFAGTMPSSANRVENFAANIDAIVRGFEASRRRIRKIILGLTVLGALSIAVGVGLTNCNTNNVAPEYQGNKGPIAEQTASGKLSPEQGRALSNASDSLTKGEVAETGDASVDMAATVINNTNGFVYTADYNQQEYLIGLTETQIGILEKGCEDLSSPTTFINSFAETVEKDGITLGDKGKESLCNIYANFVAQKYLKEAGNNTQEAMNNFTSHFAKDEGGNLIKDSIKGYKCSIMGKEGKKIKWWSQKDFERVQNLIDPANSNANTNADNTNTGSSVVNNLGNGQYGGSKVQPPEISLAVAKTKGPRGMNV